MVEAAVSDCLKMEAQIYIGETGENKCLIGLSSSFHGLFIFNQASRRSCSVSGASGASKRFFLNYGACIQRSLQC